MKSFFNFWRQFLFIEQSTGNVSHTKFFSIVGYTIMCWSFTWVVYVGKTEIDYMLWLLFGVVVIGNRTVKTLVDKQPK